MFLIRSFPIMHRHCAVLLFGVIFTIFFQFTQGGWIQELTSPNGYDAGNGLKLHLTKDPNKQKNENTTFLERHTFSANYGEYALQVAKAPDKEAVQLRFVVGDPARQARGKNNNWHIHVLLGYKIALFMTITLAVLGALVLKAFGLASLALVSSMVLFVIKLFHQTKSHARSPSYVEIESIPESYVMPEFASTATGDYHPSGAANYYTYSNYVTTANAGSQPSYGTLDGQATNLNTTAIGQSQQVAGVVASARRRDAGKKKHLFPLLTVRRYSIESEE